MAIIRIICSGQYAALILMLFTAAAFLFCEKHDNQPFETSAKESTGIILNDKSTVRVDPILYSSIITYAYLGNQVQILDRSAETAWIGDKNDYWYKIKTSNGLSGWTFGNNIKIFKPDQTGEIDRFLSRFWKNEKANLMKSLSGRWRSVDKFDNLTNQCVELYSDGKYKSYCTDCTPIEGEYKINFKNYEIIFDKATSFGSKVNYLTTANIYFLKKPDNGIKFKRVKRKIEAEDSDETETDAEKDED